MFCSTYASPKSPINVVRWNEALSALQQLSNLQSLQILLSEHCWDDFFDQRSKKYEDFNASQAERLLYHTSTPWYRDPEVERGIEQILPYLEWVKSIRCKGEVIIQMFEKAEVAGGTCVYVLGEELKLRDGLLVGH
jgi:hypothetical protein